MTTLLVFNDTSTSSVLDLSDVTESRVNVSERGVWGRRCGGEGGGCNVTLTSGDVAVCRRLAPPPLPPWLRDSPGRLYHVTRHCRSWSLYRELCSPDAGNGTQRDPPHGQTTDGEVRVKLAAASGIQWVIPALALVVVLLLLVLAMVLYKYYSRPHKKSMYRVSGSAYRFKPPQTGGNWARGPLVESETSDSCLGQSAEGAGPDFRYTRSPVCRLLEQTQYIATPTEDQHRPRPVGPPAFTSPAYFLPSLSWLRLPLLRQAWPGESSRAARDTTLYNAATPVHTDHGETTHHWQNEGEGQSRSKEDPEYSELWDGPSHYSSLSQGLQASNGIGPYEYEMQERANGQRRCDCEGDDQRPQPDQTGQEHRYEKLWICREGGDSSPEGSSPSISGTCESNWLSRYRLPSPCVPPTAPSSREDTAAEHLHPTQPGMAQEELTSDTELLPCECLAGESLTVALTDRDFLTSNRERNGCAEVKYANPMYEGGGRQCLHAQDASPLSRLWGYIGWNKR